MSDTSFPPRFMRTTQACHYLGVNRNLFNVDIRPKLTEIRVGIIGVRFDRLELDEWADDHKQRNGRPPELKGDDKCQREESQASSSAAASGTYRKRSKCSGASVSDFEKALESVRSKKRKPTLPEDSRRSRGR